MENRESLDEEEALQLRLISETLEMYQDIEYWVFHRRDKGARSRFTPVRPDLQHVVLRRMQSIAPDELVFRTVHSGADIHYYRGQYIKAMYLRYARNLEDIPFDRINPGTGKRYQSDVYCCRGDEKGRRLDRRAFRLCSYAVGHSRIDVIPRNYLYGM